MKKRFTLPDGKDFSEIREDDPIFDIVEEQIESIVLTIKREIKTRLAHAFGDASISLDDGIVSVYIYDGDELFVKVEESISNLISAALNDKLVPLEELAELLKELEEGTERVREFLRNSRVV